MFDSSQMLFALTVNNYLFQFLTVLDLKGWILSLQLMQCVSQLIFLSLLFKSDSSPNNRLGKMNRLDLYITVFSVECIVDASVF